MKYGVIYYKDTDNIGDDIQTYAAYKFLPRVDYVIDREHLQEFIPKKKEYVKTIANGWYNHDKLNFLFSPYIYPYLVSVHFSKNDLVTDSGYSFIDGYAKEYLKKFEPIGCRDYNTQKVLKDLGYKTYFSACLTLTIDQIGKKKQEDYICAVDLKPEIVKHIKSITNSRVKEVSHWLLCDEKLPYDEKRKIIDEYTKETFENRKKYVIKNSKLTFEQRMRNVEKLLTTYQNAKLVITDRIHVALPCLALQTPVIFIYYDYNADRVETFKDFLINYTEEEFLKLESKDIKVKNKDTYLKYRNELKEACSKFLSEEINDDNLMEIDNYKDFVGRMNQMKKICLKKIYKDKALLEERANEIENNKKEIEELKEENIRLKEYYDEYNRITNSRSWKLIGKYYNRKNKKSGGKDV